jgi:acetyl esterase/lipase
LFDPARRRLLALAAAGLLPACSPLGAFNVFAGADEGAERAAAGLPYGTHSRQRMDIWRPAAATGASPVVIFFYGGSWNSGEREEYAFVGRALAARGFVTVIPDYRLVPEVRFPAFLEDGAACVRVVQDRISEYGGDPRRVALAGHSAGAWTALMLALDRRWLTAAGAGTGRVRAVAGLAGPYDFLPFRSPAALDAFGTWPRPQETQPIAFARTGAPPAFLATGLDDTTVLPRNSVALARALAKAGTAVTLREYPGIDHAGILLALSVRLRERAPVLEEMAGFLREATTVG